MLPGKAVAGAIVLASRHDVPLNFTCQLFTPCRDRTYFQFRPLTVCMPMPRCRRETAGRKSASDWGATWWFAFVVARTPALRIPRSTSFSKPSAKYAIRLPTNRVSQGRIGYLLKRPVRFHSYSSFPQMFQRPRAREVRPGTQRTRCPCHRSSKASAAPNQHRKACCLTRDSNTPSDDLFREQTA